MAEDYDDCDDWSDLFLAESKRLAYKGIMSDCEANQTTKKEMSKIELRQWGKDMKNIPHFLHEEIDAKRSSNYQNQNSRKDHLDNEYSHDDILFEDLEVRRERHNNEIDKLMAQGLSFTEAVDEWSRNHREI